MYSLMDETFTLHIYTFHLFFLFSLCKYGGALLISPPVLANDH